MSKAEPVFKMEEVKKRVTTAMCRRAETGCSRTWPFVRSL